MYFLNLSLQKLGVLNQQNKLAGVRTLRVVLRNLDKGKEVVLTALIKKRGVAFALDIRCYMSR